MKSFLLLITIALSVVSFLQSVDAVDKNTKSKDVCKLSKLQPEDGTQIRDGSCSQTVQGEIPNVNNLVATMITFPQDGQTIQAGKTFTIRTKTVKLATGFFSDPAIQYNLLPQTLDNKGQIQGHSHVTVQKAADVLDATKFVFFKGLNDPADRNGELTTVVDKGLPSGSYRLCTMVSSFTHQPVIMPIAQRGAQDDCVRFKVANGGKKKRGLKTRHH